MFRKIALVTALTLNPVVLAATAGSALAASQTQGERTFEAAMRMEVRGWQRVMGSWDRALTRAGVTLTDEAKAAHAQGEATYETAVATAQDGKYLEAYDLLYDAWVQHLPATREAVRNAPPEASHTILEAFVDGLGARIEIMGAHIDKAPASAVAEYERAVAAYRIAEQEHAANRPVQTLDALTDAMQAVHGAFKEAATQTSRKHKRG